MSPNGERKWIEVVANGPYAIHGNIPLVRKSQVVSEFGEPLTWMKEDTIPASGTYLLCRCGQSRHKPFCDGTHNEVHFDGTETADTRTTAQRQVTYRASGIIVKRDYTLCMESGFCGNRVTNVEWMLKHTNDPQVRAQVMAMIERCPSGSYVYKVSEDEPDIEPDLPQQIAVTIEMTDEGPIHGPLWVTGGIPIERSDGKPLETRNRVTLCCCGQSKEKPLCDGMHRHCK